MEAVLGEVGAAEEVGIAAITASELLRGVYRARPEHRAATGRRSSRDVGAHERLVAATAIAAGWRVGTANVKHFERVPGLDVVAITWRTEA